MESKNIILGATSLRYHVPKTQLSINNASKSVPSTHTHTRGLFKSIECIFMRGLKSRGEYPKPVGLFTCGQKSTHVPQDVEEWTAAVVGAQMTGNNRYFHLSSVPSDTSSSIGALASGSHRSNSHGTDAKQTFVFVLSPTVVFDLIRFLNKH